MTAKISRWILFSITLPLIPILVTYISIASKNSGWPSLGLALKGGELFLLSTSFAAVGLGELLGVNQKRPIAVILVGGVSVLNIVISTLLYTSANQEINLVAQSFYLKISYLIFIFSCLVSTSCIVLSEVKDV